MTLNNKRVFVSGGAGVIGQELCPLLLSMGAIVMTGDLKPCPSGWNNKIIYRQGDLNFITKSEIETFRPEIFIHLAATFERTVENYGFWEENYRHNIRLSHHVMDMMKDCPTLRRVIFASSYVIYDPDLYTFTEAQRIPRMLKETDPVYPRNLTGMAKLAHEMEIRFLAGFNENLISFACVRIFRGYGKGSRCIISRWIRSLLKNEEILVYRKEGIFDFIYAGDTARGLVELAKTTDIKGIINLGTGKSRPVSDILDILKKHFPALKYKEIESDIPYEASQADMSLFEKLTEWVPSRLPEDTIPEIINYERENAAVNQNTFNVLVTSISRKIPLLKAVRQACEKFGTGIKIFGGDMDPHCPGRFFTDFFWQMPEMPGLQVNDVIDYCLQNHIRAIIPTRDGELAAWSSMKETLGLHGIGVMIGSTPGVELCMDKLLFSQFLTEKNFPVIPAFSSIDDIQSTHFVVKERFGAGSRLIAIHVTKEAALEQALKMESPVFQPFVLGKEFSVDVYVDMYGKAKGAVVRTRDLVMHGESQVTTSVSYPELEKMCCHVAETLLLYGHVNFQVIEDETGNFQIVECNARFGGASTLSIALGLDSFYWFLLETANIDISDIPFVHSVSGKTQIRFPEDFVFSDPVV